MNRRSAVRASSACCFGFSVTARRNGVGGNSRPTKPPRKYSISATWSEPIDAPAPRARTAACDVSSGFGVSSKRSRSSDVIAASRNGLPSRRARRRRGTRGSRPSRAASRDQLVDQPRLAGALVADDRHQLRRLESIARADDLAQRRRARRFGRPARCAQRAAAPARYRCAPCCAAGRRCRGDRRRRRSPWVVVAVADDASPLERRRVADGRRPDPGDGLVLSTPCASLSFVAPLACTRARRSGVSS